MTSRQVDLSAERVNWVHATLFQLPAGAVWVENAAYDEAHARCRALQMQNPDHLYLKGQPALPGFTAAELRRKGLAGIYRLRKRGEK